MKISKSEYPEIARKLAEDILSGIPDEYEKFVKENINDYDKPPDREDFEEWISFYV